MDHSREVLSSPLFSLCLSTTCHLNTPDWLLKVKLQLSTSLLGRSRSRRYMTPDFFARPTCYNVNPATGLYNTPRIELAMAMLSLPTARSTASGLLRALPRATSSCTRHGAFQPIRAVRHKSGPYGYTQAKALVFSKCGEPSEVLR